MSRTRREIEALADLFVGIPATPVPASEDRVIRLIEGHLPVRATLWRRPALSVIVDHAQATLLEIDDRQVHITRHKDPHANKPSDLEHAIGQPAAGHTWIIASSIVMEAGNDWSNYDEVVLLTGADQAASVAAYRHIKSVVTSSTTPPKVSFIMAGSPEPTALAAADRLITTASSHLSMSPVCRGVISQMDTGDISASHTVSAGSALVGDVVASIRARVSASSAPRTSEAAASPVADEATESKIAPKVHASRELPPVSASLPPSAHTVPLEMEDGDARRSVSQAPAAAAMSTLPLPNLQPVEIAELPSGIVAGLDAHGCLHVMSEGDTGLLEIARGWAMRHRSLLAASIPTLDIAAAVVADLIVFDVHQASDLADGPWQVHLKIGDHVTKVLPRQN